MSGLFTSTTVIAIHTRAKVRSLSIIKVIAIYPQVNVWLPIKYRIDYKVLLLAFKCLHKDEEDQPRAPVYLADLLQPYLPARALRSHDNMTLQEPRTKMSTYGDRAFSASGAKLWNELPKELREIDSLTVFKRCLKTHLFKIAYEC